MLFNSLVFILFALVFFSGWRVLRAKNNVRWLYLTAASFFFYGWWDWRFLLLILGSGFIDYFSALAIARWPSRRRLLLVVSLVGNVGSLGIFKYADFFIGNANWLLGLFGAPVEIPLARLMLPVGISFYTFQSMSYTIDVYRGRLDPTRNVLHFFAYLSMFPQLVAGPIVRASDLLPQLKHAVPTTEKQRWDGFCLIVRGYFKKVVVADTLAPFINAAYGANVPTESSAYWWLIAMMFTFQIYCDFSGYSDIARGLAKWMGYEFPLNFNHPYISRSFREFWERWHISLSSWFRDYVYFPLGGSRRGSAMAFRNLWIVMLVSGLWHGSAWTFVAWGALHAMLLSIERLTNWPRKLSALPGGRHLSALIVFVMIVVSWVFFRAGSFAQAGAVLGQMFTLNFNVHAIPELVHVKAIIVLTVMLFRQVYVHLALDESRLARARWVEYAQPVAMGLLLTACIFLRGPGAAFIYFQF